IAADLPSPWHTIAPYLVARLDIRRGLYPAAITELRAIVDNPQLSGIHRQAQQLMYYAEARSNPANYMALCAKQLMDPNPADLAHSLRDYTYLYDHFKAAGIGEEG